MMLILLCLLAFLALFPIGDDNEGRSTTPYITYILIGLNVLVYVGLQGVGTNEMFTFGYSTVPREITTGQDFVGRIGKIPQAPGPNPIYLTILSAMFMHGSLMHIGGNMLYLWIFGDNLEHAMGHFKFLAFYLLCGLLATAAHIFSDPNSVIPSLGASGAIAGVLGGYLLMYPARGVRVLIGYLGIVQMPAFIVIGLWAVLQFYNGFGALVAPKGGGGVAYMAHIGGFVAGFILVKLFAGKNARPHDVTAPRYDSWGGPRGY